MNRPTSRRGFLLKALGGAAGLAGLTAFVSPAQAGSSSRRKRWGYPGRFKSISRSKLRRLQYGHLSSISRSKLRHLQRGYYPGPAYGHHPHLAPRHYAPPVGYAPRGYGSRYALPPGYHGRPPLPAPRGCPPGFNPLDLLER